MKKQIWAALLGGLLLFGFGMISNWQPRRPDVSDLHERIRASLRKERPAEALAVLKEALRLDPDNAETWCLLGDLFVWDGDVKGYWEAYEMALRCRPYDNKVRQRVGRAHMDAIAIFAARALKNAENSPEADFHREIRAVLEQRPTPVVPYSPW